MCIYICYIYIYMYLYRFPHGIEGKWFRRFCERKYQFRMYICIYVYIFKILLYIYVYINAIYIYMYLYRFPHGVERKWFRRFCERKFEHIYIYIYVCVYIYIYIYMLRMYIYIDFLMVLKGNGFGDSVNVSHQLHYIHGFYVCV
jgi:hypothetical protein